MIINLKTVKKYFFPILMSGIVIYLFTLGIFNIIMLRNRPRYTLGLTEKIYYTGRTGIDVGFYYKVDGKEYKNYTDIGKLSDVKVPNHYYIVKYVDGFPSISELQLNFEVDSLIFVPINGWDENPMEITK